MHQVLEGHYFRVLPLINGVPITEKKIILSFHLSRFQNLSFLLLEWRSWINTYFDQGISYTNIHIFTEAQNVNAFATSVDGRQLTCADDPQTCCQKNREKQEKAAFIFSLSAEISQGTATVSSRSLCVTCILGAYKPLKFTSVAEVSLPHGAVSHKSGLHRCCGALAV